MADLELVGIHPDGDHLILIDPDGGRHRLPIDEAVRAAVRRDRPQLEKVRSDQTPRPRQIQALIRAGATAELVAEESGLAVEQVRRYEGPVLAEREHVAQRARGFRVGRSADSPTLGDLVVDRLAARGVSTDAIQWDARREGGDPWRVSVRFHAGDSEQEAAWQVDLASSLLTALDDESRWLSETDLAGAGRHLNSVRGAGLYDVEADGDITPVLHAVDAVIRDSRPRLLPERRTEPEPEPETESESEEDAAAREQEATAAMLAELQGSRGVRQRAEPEADELPGQDELGLWDEPPAAHPPASRPQEATDATVLPGPGAAPAGDQDREDGAGPEHPRRSRRNRRTRRSVPSWDEIVFGAKDD